MFRNREDAAQRLAVRLRGRALRTPLVLAIPRGGVVIGAVLARELSADLDVVLSRKLRAPEQPELALGAIAETGEVYLNSYGEAWAEDLREYLEQERQFQLAEVARRRGLFRGERPQAPVAGRSVILTDDGIATGSTMIAALHVVGAQQAHETIVAVPVAAPDRLEQIQELCDEVVCLMRPRQLGAIGQYYEDFTQVGDDEVLDLLRAFPAQA